MSKTIHICLIFSWKQKYLVAYISERNKSIELQKLACKVKLSHKMNESRNNQYIKTKSVKLPFKTRNSNISFCFFKYFMLTSCDDSSALTEFTPLWKTKVSSYLYVTKKEIWLAVYSRSNLILVWHTYISHSLTDSLTHWPVHNIPDAPTKGAFL